MVSRFTQLSISRTLKRLARSRRPADRRDGEWIPGELLLMTSVGISSQRDIEAELPSAQRPQPPSSYTPPACTDEPNLPATEIKGPFKRAIQNTAGEAWDETLPRERSVPAAFGATHSCPHFPSFGDGTLRRYSDSRTQRDHAIEASLSACADPVALALDLPVIISSWYSKSCSRRVRGLTTRPPKLNYESGTRTECTVIAQKGSHLRIAGERLEWLKFSLSR